MRSYAKATPAQHRLVRYLQGQCGLDDDALHAILRRVSSGRESLKGITKREVSALVTELKGLVGQEVPDIYHKRTAGGATLAQVAKIRHLVQRLEEAGALHDAVGFIEYLTRRTWGVRHRGGERGGGLVTPGKRDVDALSKDEAGRVIEALLGKAKQEGIEAKDEERRPAGDGEGKDHDDTTSTTDTMQGDDDGDR